MKIKMLAVHILAFIMIFTAVTVYGSEGIPNEYLYNKTNASFDIDIYGNNDERISVLVFTPDFGLYKKGELSGTYTEVDFLKYAYGFNAQKGGLYKNHVTFSDSDPNGKYLIKITSVSGDVEYCTELEYAYVSDATINACISAFTLCKGDELYDKITAYEDVLSTDSLVGLKIDENSQTYKWFDLYKEAEKIETIFDIENLLRKSIIIEAVSQNDTVTLDLLNSNNKQLYNEITGGDCVEKFSALFAKNVSDITTGEQFVKFVSHIKALALLNGATTSKAVELISANADALGVNLSELDEYSVTLTEVCKKLDFKDVSKYYQSLNEYIINVAQQLKNTSSSLGGASAVSGGGGGGGASYKPSVTPVVLPDTDTNAKNYFSDLDGFGWAADAINILYEREIINGVDEQNFAPKRTVTREEFVKLIVNALSINDNSGEKIEFDDCDVNDWYYPYVKAAYNNGIIKGISNKTFGSGMGIKREDMCVIIKNALSSMKIKETTSYGGFADEAEISDYAKSSVEYAVQRGIINGYEDNTFCSQQYMSRAEAAVVISRILSLL